MAVVLGAPRCNLLLHGSDLLVAMSSVGSSVSDKFVENDGEQFVVVRPTSELCNFAMRNEV